jgi:KDO2-lipid IV(A) lauroyltransferase
MAAFFFYCFVYPLSKLPLRVIYFVSDFFYVVTLTIFPYRKEVITNNLKRSFPDKTEQEIKNLRKKFYRHFTDLLAEGIKNLSISKKELLSRVHVENPELMDELYAKGKSVLLVSGHYNNWEWLITGQSLLFKHQAVGIGMPLSSKFWNKKLNELRARFGMKIIHAKIVKESFESLKNEAIATLILSDQSPGDSTKSYWMNFLHQQTAVLYGCEQLAHTYNQAVVFYAMRKVKRGYYKIHLTLITENPRETAWGFITESHTKLLEKEIRANPAYWMWSHKRWKREVPKDLAHLKEIQREKFEKNFKS